MFYKTKCVYWNNRRSSAPICVRTVGQRRQRERIRGGLGMINVLPATVTAAASYLQRICVYLRGTAGCDGGGGSAWRAAALQTYRRLQSRPDFTDTEG